jgi:hypothetical protein
MLFVSLSMVLVCGLGHLSITQLVCWALVNEVNEHCH